MKECFHWLTLYLIMIATFRDIIISFTLHDEGKNENEIIINLIMAFCV